MQKETKQMQLFNKKKAQGEPSPLTQRIITLHSQGISETEIIRTLRKEGLKPDKVDAAMEDALEMIDAAAKKPRKKAPLPPKPSPAVKVEAAPKTPKPPQPAVKVVVDQKTPKPPAASPKPGKAPEAPKPGVSIEIGGKQAAGKPSVTVSVYDSAKAPKPAPKDKARKADKASLEKADKELFSAFTTKPPPEKKEMADLKQTLSSIKRSSEEMAKDMKKVKSRSEKLPEKKHLDEIKEMLKKAPARAPAPAKAPPVPRPASAALRRPVPKPAKVPVPEPPAATKPAPKTLPRARVKPPVARPKPARKPAPASDLRGLKRSMRSLDRSAAKTAKQVESLRLRLGDFAQKRQIDELRKALDSRPEPRIPDSEMQPVRQATASLTEFTRDFAGVKIKLQNLEKASESFTERLSTLGKDISDMKVRQISEKKERPQDPGHAERMRMMEDALKGRERADDRISGMESRLKEVEKNLVPKDREGSEQDHQKNIYFRLDSVDTRITGMMDKLVQLSGDMQKLTSYFMEGIKHMESRMRIVEKAAQKQEEEAFLRRRPKPAAFQPPELPEMPEPLGPEDEPEEGPDMGMPLPAPPQPPAPQEAPAEPPFAYAGPPKPAPQAGRLAPPAPPGQPYSSIFTKLRESTMVRRPYPRMDPDAGDLEILAEHIRESARRSESREKIQRDLMNAGYDEELISRAFTQVRVE